MNSKVDAYLGKAKQWRKEMMALRAVALDCGLAEELKWGKPCYTFRKSNVVIIQAFKGYCALGFFKGALLKDAGGVLVKPGDNSQTMRQMRFTDVREIVEMQSTVEAYVHEAIAVEEAGLKVEKSAKLVIPEELQARFDEMPDLKTAFDALTPGRRRAYVLHFAAPKKASTRTSRIERCVPRILEGKGLNER